MTDTYSYKPDDELTTSQAALVARLNRRTIVAWIQAGHLPATQLPGARGHYRIAWKDLQHVLHRPVNPKGKTIAE